MRNMFSFRLLTSLGQIKKSESSCGIEQQTISTNTTVVIVSVRNTFRINADTNAIL